MLNHGSSPAPLVHALLYCLERLWCVITYSISVPTMVPFRFLVLVPLTTGIQIKQQLVDVGLLIQYGLQPPMGTGTDFIAISNRHNHVTWPSRATRATQILSLGDIAR